MKMKQEIALELVQLDINFLTSVRDYLMTQSNFECLKDGQAINNSVTNNELKFNKNNFNDVRLYNIKCLNKDIEHLENVKNNFELYLIDRASLLKDITSKINNFNKQYDYYFRDYNSKTSVYSIEDYIPRIN